MTAYLQNPILPQVQEHWEFHMCSSHLNYFISYLLKKTPVALLPSPLLDIMLPPAFKVLSELYSIVAS